MEVRPLPCEYRDLCPRSSVELERHSAKVEAVRSSRAEDIKFWICDFGFWIELSIINCQLPSRLCTELGNGSRSKRDVWRFDSARGLCIGLIFGYIRARTGPGFYPVSRNGTDGGSSPSGRLFGMMR